MMKRSLRVAWTACLVGSAAAGLFDWFKDKQAEVIVEGHRWQRSVQILALQQGDKKTWCSEMPADAYGVNESLRESGTRRVEQRSAEDGKLYTYREFMKYYGPEEKRVAVDGNAYTHAEFLAYYGAANDRGAEEWTKATIAEQTADSAEVAEKWEKAGRDCTGACCPLCGEEVVEREWCEYQINRWHELKKLETSGSDAYPFWPKTVTTDCEEVGCTKRGATTEQYTLDLTEVAEDGKRSKTYCTTEHGGWSIETWRSMAVGYASPVQRRLGYGVLCGSIKVPESRREEQRMGKDGKPYSHAEFVEFYGHEPARAAKEWADAKRARDEM